MKGFFKFFAERHLLANLLTIMIVLMGAFSFFQINLTELPNIEMGVVIIRTRYLGASPEDVELNVTNKIEDELKSVTGIKDMRSISMENSSVITVDIDEDVPDMAEVVTDIRDAVARVNDLPPEVTESPVVIQEKTSLFSVLEVGMTSSELSYAELREYARLFEKKLEDIPGVARIERSGYRAREVRVEVSPEKMMKYQVAMRDILAAIEARNIRASGGSLESYTSEKNVVTLEKFRNPLDVGDVIVRSTFDGAMVRVQDLAIIYDDFEEPSVIPRINGKTTISFQVTKKENADIIRTVDAIKALARQEKEHLPESIQFLYTEDESLGVRNKFNIVRSNGILGLALVLAVLILFLNPRSSFWVAMGIPVSLLGVIALLPFLGLDLDSIVMISMIIIIGIIVDDAIVIAENIFQRREQGEAPLEAAVNGLHEVALPVLTSITTTLFAFFPMFFMQGVVGKFVYYIPLTISLALFMSLLESFLILPAHLVPGLRKAKKQAFARTWFQPVRDRFEHWLFSALRLRYIWCVLAIALLAGSLIYAATSMEFVMFSSEGATVISTAIELPLGTSLQATAEKSREIEAIVGSLPDDELESYIMRIGASAGEDAQESPHVATLTVNLTPHSFRKRSANEILKDLRQRMASLQGIERMVFNVEIDGPPVGEPIEIRIKGDDDGLRTTLADEVVAFLNQMKGVTDIDRDDKPGKDEVSIRVNHALLARYGLTVADIARNVRIAYDGQVVTSTRYGEEDVEFRVIFQKQFRQNIDYVKQVKIPNKQGEFIGLGEVSSLEIRPGISALYHDDRERAIAILGKVDTDVTTPLKVADEVLEHFTALSEQYPGVQLDVGGEAEESSETIINLIGSFGLAALGIYFLLILLFNSVTQPFMVLLIIPFGISGVIVAFALHGAQFSLIAMIGVIGMAGVVVNNALILVDHLNTLKLDPANVSSANPRDMAALIASGTANRLRPILLTTLTTVAGLLPLVYGLGGWDPMMSPMAMALGYGLLFASPLTLVLLPCLYMIGYDLEKVRQRIQGMAQEREKETTLRSEFS